MKLPDLPIFALLAASILVPSVAAASDTRPRAPQGQHQTPPPPVVSGWQYERDIEVQLEHSERRIRRAMWQHRVPPWVAFQIDRDVRHHQRVLRDTARRFANDGHVTWPEQWETDRLSAAIARDLRHRYGSIDSFELVAPMFGRW